MGKKEDVGSLYSDHSDMLPPVSMFHGSRMLQLQISETLALRTSGCIRVVVIIHVPPGSVRQLGSQADLTMCPYLCICCTSTYINIEDTLW